MYDYISLFSDDEYSRRISIETLEQFLLDEMNFTKESNLVFSKRIGEEYIKLRGILANSYGNYAYDTLEGINEVNLIEIDIPDIIFPQVEEHILEIANAIGKKFSWYIFDHETFSKIKL